MNPTTENSGRNHERSRSSGGTKNLARVWNALVRQVAQLLTPRRIRAHALILALCLWGVFAIDYSTPGLFDRAGNLKFQDFLPFYVSTHFVRDHRARDLYDQRAITQAEQAIVHYPRLRLPNLYGPQVALFFTPFGGFSFVVAAASWVAFGLMAYFLCIFSVCRLSATLRSHGGLILLCAVAYPSVYEFVVRAQISPLVLGSFTIAFLALRRERPLIAGFALGFLVGKPQFILAIPLVFLLARSWMLLLGLIASSLSQLLFARFWFGEAVMQDYFSMLRHAPDWINTAELSLASIQMHSLRSFWELLIPWPIGVWILYFFSSMIVIVVAARIWKSQSPLAVRFSALLIAVVLVNPHIYIYDLLALGPIFLLVAEWSIQNADHPNTPALRVLLYLAFLLPLLGPLARWTHLQLSVIVFAALLWNLQRVSASSATALP